MQSAYQEILPATGVDFVTTLNLTPSTLISRRNAKSPQTSIPFTSSSRVLTNLVAAQNNWLRIYEIRKEDAQLPSISSLKSRRGMEAVAGEIEMDSKGEGFVSVDTVKSAPKRTYQLPTTTHLRLIREHRLHGVITGLGRVQTLSTLEDGLDRLVISFKEAKISVIEWSDNTHDISTVSIHSYERAPQLMSSSSSLYNTLLRIDPSYRCASFLLPHDGLAILPFNQAQLDVDVMNDDLDPNPSNSGSMKNDLSKEIPYSPSYILDLCSVDERIRNVIDFAFLPGYSTPTVAVLYQTTLTWTGRLKESKDTTSLLIFTLPSSQALSLTSIPIISSTSSLPYDAFSITPCPPSLGGGGGVIVLTTNSIIYIEGGKKVGVGVNGWAGRVSDDTVGFELPEGVLATAEFDMEDGEAVGSPKTLRLEGAYICFPPISASSTTTTDPSALLVTSSGLFYELKFTLSGRTISKLGIKTDKPVGRGTIPSCVEILDVGDGPHGDEIVFVGSNVGVSTLIKVGLVPKEDGRLNGGGDGGGGGGEKNGKVEGTEENVNLDAIDDDIYGDSLPVQPSTSITAITNTGSTSAEITYKMRLNILDSLPAVGPITDLTFIAASNGERAVPELVASTGASYLGGFTFFQHILPMRFKRKLHALGGSHGIWEIPLRESPHLPSGSVAAAGGGIFPGCTSVILSTEASPAPGLSRVATRPRKGDVFVMSRYNGTTVGAGPFFQGTAIVQITTNSVRLLGTDGVERQTIKDVDRDTGAARAKIRSCSISDPFIVFVREDNTLGLFIGEKGGVRRKDMTHLGVKASRYSAARFFSDESNTLRPVSNPSFQSNGASKSKVAATTSLEAVTDAERGTQWLLLCRLNGVIEIWTLPKLTLVFSTATLPQAPSVCVDSFASATTFTEEITNLPEETTIEDVVVSSIGDAKDRHYLTVLFKGGQVDIYELIKVPSHSTVPSNRELILPIQLFKTQTYAFPRPDPEIKLDSSVTAGKKGFHRALCPFTYRVSSSESILTIRSGIFVIGDHALWILGSEKGGIQIHRCQYSSVSAFTPTSLYQSSPDPQPSRDFIMHTDAGPILTEWLQEYNVEGAMPMRSMKQGKAYTHVKYDTGLGLLLAAAAHPSKFRLFDEDGNAVWEPEGQDVPEPSQTCSTLELISPEDGFVIDGYEFAWNEYVNSLEIVTLESLSTEEGRKEFVACGTTIFRGEDLAAKGATYIFEIVEVVPSPPEDYIITPIPHPKTNGAPHRDDGDMDDGSDRENTPVQKPQWENIEFGRHYRLKLLCKDECKGAVTAVCSMNGYLVSSMGQKIFVRAFELDERLVGVAFLDVGVYVTSLTCLKNLLLIGDVNRSVQFVVFQEDPFKLIIVSRDMRLQSIISANFIYSGGEMGIVTRDRDGVIRVWGYEPYHVDTAGGQHLLLRSEFNTQTYSWCALPIIERSYPPSNANVIDGADVGANANAGMMDDGDPQLKILWGCTDGSINALVPLPTLPGIGMDLDVSLPNMTIGGLNMGMGDAGMPMSMAMDVTNQGEMNMMVEDPPASASNTPIPGAGSTGADFSNDSSNGAVNLGVSIPMAAPEVGIGMGDEGEEIFIPQAGAEISKRLHLLQGRLVRGVQHAAGLNPRAFRALSNPTSISSTKLSSTSKSILDVALLQQFYTLSFDRQNEMCKEIGASRGEVLKDLEIFDCRRVW